MEEKKLPGRPRIFTGEMRRLNIEVSRPAFDFIEELVRAGRYSGKASFIRVAIEDLMRKEQRRRS